jgi:hypothetical protein
MKPLGISHNFQVIKPSKVEDQIWEAVEEAINAGWTPEQFKREVSSAWEDSLKCQIKNAQNVFKTK